MKKPAIASAGDIRAFFEAYNRHDWDSMFNYMSDDCVWDASEKRMKGRRNIIDYWVNFHASFRETLGEPENIVFGDGMVYLQVPVRLDFIEDGVFSGKRYEKGGSVDFTCADFYKLNSEGKIESGCVFVKFNNT